MLVEVSGKLSIGVTAKDVALAIIGKIGTAGGTGYVIEYGGDTIRSFSMEGRMTLLQHVNRSWRESRIDCA